ncbi:hypothetical protein AGMMS49940_21410 [Spirochaetia bacterium]|nr:hypothetical protein AGMMS49940_21410 [Spirochaetia bacterium]
MGIFIFLVLVVAFIIFCMIYAVFDFIGDFAHGLVDHAADRADERAFRYGNDEEGDTEINIDARQVHYHIKKDD